MVYSNDGTGEPPRPQEAMQQFDRQKFKALIHYVVSKCPPEHLGRTKLNKVGFYADMMTYLQLGRPLTGESYVKQPHGPAAKHLLSSLGELLGDGALQEQLVPYYGFSRYQYKSLREPDLTRITPEERAILDDVIQFVCVENTAQSISEHSHTDAWRAAQQGEEIPYFAATELFLEDGDVDERDRAWAEEELATRESEKPEYREVRGKSLRDVGLPP